MDRNRRLRALRWAVARWTRLGPAAAALVCVLVLAGAPASTRADSILSENWSGYAAHGHGVRFGAVTAAWKQPKAACPGDYPTYSATWVGLGGYKIGARWLEQIGTELDCTGFGQARVSAWYELVPALPRAVPITVRPGDRISARVSVSGRRVTLELADRARRRTFSRTVRVGAVDVSSADWIVEAPTGCDAYGNCMTLPLSDFGSVRLSGARARTSGGRWGPIASPLWGFTRIRLRPDPYYYAADGSAAVAIPSPLRRAGASFDVDYARTSASGRRGGRAASGLRPPVAVNPGGASR